MRVRSRHKSSRRRLVQVLFLSGLVIGVGILLPKAFSAVVATVAYPIHATNVWLDQSTSLVPSFIRSRQSLQSEIETLQNDLVIADRTSLTHRRLLSENNYLRQLLAAGEEARVAAAVIARPNELPYDLLQIDRGSQDGIEVGAPVYVGADVVIGLVVHTANKYSFVELVTTPGFEATAFIAGPDVVVTMEGRGGGIARVRVPQGIPIAEGNLVHLPSIDPGVFGRIAYVENEPTQPEQYGYISPDISLSSLHYVAVGEQSQLSRSAEEIDERILEIMRSSLVVKGVTVVDVATTSSSTADVSVTESSI